MMFLLQLLANHIPDRDMFHELFSDLDYELNDMGWKDDPETLINDMLFSHYGLTIEDEFQLKEVTRIILNKQMFDAVIGTVNSMKKGA